MKTLKVLTTLALVSFLSFSCSKKEEENKPAETTVSESTETTETETHEPVAAPVDESSDMTAPTSEGTFEQGESEMVEEAEGEGTTNEGDL